MAPWPNRLSWVIAVTIVLCSNVRRRPPSTTPGHEVTTDHVEGRRPAPDANPVAEAQALEPFVVADRVPIVFGQVAVEVDAQARRVEAGQAAVVVDRLVADVAARQLDVVAGRLAVRQPAAPTERRGRAPGDRAALATGDRDHQGVRECHMGLAFGSGKQVSAVTGSTATAQPLS